jgi:hypothetical protein
MSRERVFMKKSLNHEVIDDQGKVRKYIHTACHAGGREFESRRPRQ